MGSNTLPKSENYHSALATLPEKLRLLLTLGEAGNWEEVVSQVSDLIAALESAKAPISLATPAEIAQIRQISSLLLLSIEKCSARKAQIADLVAKLVPMETQALTP